MPNDPRWLAVAKTLRAGSRIRIECCASDKSCMVSNDPKGFRAYCFRCGPVGLVPHGMFSVADLQRRREELAWQSTKTVTLPHDFTLDIPQESAVWLYRAGVSAAIARAYGIGYSPSIQRIIIPIYKNGVLDAYIARANTGVKPKYIERTRTGYSYFRDDARFRIAEPDRVGVVCVTEDVLSAIRVGRATGYSAVALLGTSANTGLYDELLITGTACLCIWTDPDKVGKESSRVLRRMAGLLGIPTRIIRSAKDPKYYSNERIRQYLND